MVQDKNLSLFCQMNSRQWSNSSKTHNLLICTIQSFLVSHVDSVKFGVTFSIALQASFVIIGLKNNSNNLL